MRPEDLNHYERLLKNVTEHVPPPEVPESDKYEHEMVIPETKAMYVARWGLGLISIIFFTYVIIFFIYATIFSSTSSGTEGFIVLLFFSPILLCLLYFSVKETIVYGERIKLTIAEKELIIHYPCHEIYGDMNPLTELKYPIHDIVGASIRDLWSQELKCVMSEDGREFKPHLTNTNLHPYLLSQLISPLSNYKYLLAISAQPFPLHTKFVDIEHKEGWNILVEFDDAENFISVLKRRIAK